MAAEIEDLKAIYKRGFKLVKAEVMLMGLQLAAVEQCEIDLDGDNGRERDS